MQIKQTYKSEECNTFDVYHKNRHIAYFYEHFHHVITNEKLERTIFEIYYNREEGEFVASMISENFSDILEIINEESNF